MQKLLNFVSQLFKIYTCWRFLLTVQNSLVRKHAVAFRTHVAKRFFFSVGISGEGGVPNFE